MTNSLEVSFPATDPDLMVMHLGHMVVMVVVAGSSFLMYSTLDDDVPVKSA